MTTPRSRPLSEAHSRWHSAITSEPPTEASPPTSDEGVSTQSCLDVWGNTMKKKQETTLWIAFQNIGSFQQDEEMALKLEALRRFTIEKEVDIFGFTEANTCWDVVSETNRPARRTRGWWEKCQWTLTHNRLEPHDNEKTAYQPGGTGILCINHAAHRTLRPGDDALGLGRWCWTRIQGSDGFVLCVISMYRPCCSNGPMTVYQQHLRRLTSLQRFECPKEAILVDLAKEIQTWQHEGDHVILLTDFNDDITDTSVRRWAANLGLVEAITWLHPTNPPHLSTGSKTN